MLPPPKDIPTGAVSPSAQLFADLFWHEIYAGINSRFETLWKDQSDPTHAINNLEYEKYRKMTRPFFTDEELKNSSQQKIAEAKAPEVLRNIERSLYFLEGEAMIFYPTPSNPYLGWEDFWSFVRAYESLPLKLRLGFGKYYLMIQTP